MTGRQALRIIQECIRDGDRHLVTKHFYDRMAERKLFWPDVQLLIDAPRAIRNGGEDEFGRPKWIVTGDAADGLALEIVAVIDRDERGNLTVLITIYWE